MAHISVGQVSAGSGGQLLKILRIQVSATKFAQNENTSRVVLSWHISLPAASWKCTEQLSHESKTHLTAPGHAESSHDAKLVAGEQSTGKSQSRIGSISGMSNDCADKMMARKRRQGFVQSIFLLRQTMRISRLQKCPVEREAAKLLVSSGVTGRRVGVKNSYCLSERLTHSGLRVQAAQMRDRCVNACI